MTRTHRLNTIGNEEQVQTIKAGQTIAKGGAHTRVGRELTETRRDEKTNTTQN